MTHLNLLPTNRCRQQIMRRRLRQWSFVVAAAIVLALLVSWRDLASNADALEKAKAVERQYEPIQSMQTEIDEIRKRMKTLKTQQQLAAELAKQKSIVSLLGILSRAAKSGPDRISIQNLVLTRSRVESEEGANIHRALRLEGVALDSRDISAFSSYLEEANAFQSVHLDSSSTRNIGGLEGQGYILQCEY